MVLGSRVPGNGVGVAGVAGIADTGLEDDVPQARLNRALNRRLRCPSGTVVRASRFKGKAPLTVRRCRRAAMRSSGVASRMRRELRVFWM